MKDIFENITLIISIASAVLSTGVFIKVNHEKNQKQKAYQRRKKRG